VVEGVKRSSVVSGGADIGNVNRPALSRDAARKEAKRVKREGIEQQFYTEAKTTAAHAQGVKSRRAIDNATNRKNKKEKRGT